MGVGISGLEEGSKGSCKTFVDCCVGFLNRVDLIPLCGLLDFDLRRVIAKWAQEMIKEHSLDRKSVV